jgi:DNA-binding MarR family transcriptional regulator
MKKDKILVGKIRAFNRFYTNVIGLLDQHILDSPYTLTEVRILYEIYHTKNCTAKEIRKVISIDAGYLSRVIERFVRKKFVKRNSMAMDRRFKILSLTEKGKKEFLKLNDLSEKLISNMIAGLSQKDRNELIKKMESIKLILSGS